MTMMNGLETGDLDIMDEEFFGPPPRFLVEGDGGVYENESASEACGRLSLFSGLSQIRKFVGAW
jgi:hypothetical protein